MQRHHQAYNQTATMVVADPREFDASILLKAASRFQRLRDNWEDHDRHELADALLYNRKIWTVYATSAAEMDHPLPREIKQNIANLAIFIFNRTLELQGKPEARLLDALININRQIAAGLLQKPDLPLAAAS
ncbi:flagellar biosynthesis regulator FlaF [Parvibaculum sedimenti]|uniref:Flagellar biosynthesis regulator FlaF n=2 Tax=Parvibaculum sedimenti TaxID=2608632 RepID=A0A6N6VEG5_9HYPH|nr:flagellar biosynthesis regulator FlaF [Parvibaculum sedimenti]